MMNTNLKLTHQNQITIVTVTYGSRCALLSKVVKHAVAQGIRKIIVVDNGAEWDVAAWASNNFYPYIEVVTLSRNTGSAEGFGTGIDCAIKSGAEFIWLMDDDNVPDELCVTNLIQCYQSISSSAALNKFAVCAIRQSTKTRLHSNRTITRPDSFLSFHLYDIPAKVVSRLRRKKSEIDLTDYADNIVMLDMAPYGGLLFHASVISLIGLPKKDFVLYGDDGEFTFRISQHGGLLVCCTKAGLTDIDTSWNANNESRSSFAVWLHGNNEMRIYYYARNQAWIDSHLTKANKFMYNSNKFLYMTMLVAFAFVWGRFKRLRVIFRAIREGEKGMLGINRAYELR